MPNIAFEALIARVRAGDAAATNQLVNLFSAEVTILVRRHLPTSLRRQFDTMDFFQDVWKSVITDCREREEGFAGPAHLKAYLSGVVQNKVNQAFRRRTKVQKYNIAREEPLYLRKGNRDVPREIASAEVTPSEIVQGDDCRAKLKQGKTDVEAQIIDLRLGGLSSAEIAERVGIHERSVRRVLEALRIRGETQWR